MIIDITIGIILAGIIFRLLPLAIYLFSLLLLILIVSAAIVLIAYNWETSLQILLIGMLLIAWFGSFLYLFGRLIEKVEKNIQIQAEIKVGLRNYLSFC